MKYLKHNPCYHFPRKNKIFIFTCAVLACLSFTHFSSSTHAFHPIQADWTIIKKYIADHFADLPLVTTDNLAEMLQKPEPERPVLIDARTSEEFGVSHLKNARNAGKHKKAIRILEEVDKCRPIVIYCSVGIRSAAMANRLRAAGFTNIYNLEGSIFKWANEGRPLYQGDTQVFTVHPYDSTWGQLLNKKLISTHPE